MIANGDLAVTSSPLFPNIPNQMICEPLAKFSSSSRRGFACAAAQCSSVAANSFQSYLFWSWSGNICIVTLLLPLPSFPIPTHCTPDDVDKYNLETGQRLWPAVRVRPSPETRNNLLEWLQFAPLLPVTVEDAISDLVCHNVLDFVLRPLS